MWAPRRRASEHRRGVCFLQDGSAPLRGARRSPEAAAPPGGQAHTDAVIRFMASPCDLHRAAGNLAHAPPRKCARSGVPPGAFRQCDGGDVDAVMPERAGSLYNGVTTVNLRRVPPEWDRRHHAEISPGPIYPACERRAETAFPAGEFHAFHPDESTIVRSSRRVGRHGKSKLEYTHLCVRFARLTAGRGRLRGGCPGELHNLAAIKELARLRTGGVEPS